MSFLQSGLLMALAPLALLPLLIHLLNRRLPLRILFPDIQRIVRSLAGRSRVAKWRHLIMLLLRTAAVVLTLLAFLKPVLPRFGSESAQKTKGQARKILLIADRSLSMEHKSGTQTSAAKRLLIEAGKIVTSLKSGSDTNDAVNVILAGRQPEALLPDFTTAHDQALTGLAALPPGLERADMTKALGMAATLLADRPAGAEVYILSDFQRTAWSDITFDSLPSGVRLFFVDVSDSERERPNTAILQATASSGAVSARETVRLDVVAANYSPAEITLPIEAVVDGRLATPGEMKIGAWSTARTSLDITAPGEGIHSVEVRSPADGLPADNRRWLRLDVRDREEVLVLGDDASEDAGVKFVLAALDPYDGKSGPFTVRQATTASVTPQQIGTASRIVLTGTARLPDSMVQRLVSFIEQGGGVLWFLDGAGDAENLESLNNFAGGAFVPFKLAGKLTTENFGGTPQKMARGNFDSRYLRLFRGAGRQSLGLVEFYATQRALPTGHGSVLLSFTDGMPALGSADNGLGSAVFCNFAPSELASNIARQRLFPAWVQDMVKALKPDTAPDVSVETGGTVTAELWTRDLDKSSVRAPDDSAVTAKTLVEGERVTASFVAPLPGLYTLGAPGRFAWSAAVNVPADEADLRSIDPAEIRRRSETGSGPSGNFVSGAQDYAEINTGRPVFHWFLLAAAAFVALEMLLFRPFLRAAGHAQT